MSYFRKPPKTKAELIDRMMSQDFNGDFRSIVGDGTNIVRTAENKLQINSPDGRSYELVARLPRKENAWAEERPFARGGGGDEWQVTPEDVRQEPEGRHQDRSRPSPRA